MPGAFGCLSQTVVLGIDKSRVWPHSRLMLGWSLSKKFNLCRWHLSTDVSTISRLHPVLTIAQQMPDFAQRISWNIAWTCLALLAPLSKGVPCSATGPLLLVSLALTRSVLSVVALAALCSDFISARDSFTLLRSHRLGKWPGQALAIALPHSEPTVHPINHNSVQRLRPEHVCQEVIRFRITRLLAILQTPVLLRCGLKSLR